MELIKKEKSNSETQRKLKQKAQIWKDRNFQIISVMQLYCSTSLVLIKLKK